MKNIRNTLLLIFVLSILFCPNLYARSIKISNHNIEGTINSDGSIDILEYITFDFSGQYNGIFHNVSYDKASGISNFEVYKVHLDDSTTLLKNNYSGNPETYEYSEEYKTAKIKLYSPSTNTQKTYLFKYTIDGVINKYNDIAEFYWQFISSDNTTPNSNINVIVHIPDGVLKEDIKIFAHGPLSGVSEIVDNNTVKLTLDYLPPSEFLEIRLLFPPNLIFNSYPTNNINKLEEIMDEELNWADESNKIRSNSEMTILTTAGILIAVLISLVIFAMPILIIILTIVIYYKHVKLPKPSIDYDYYRELPGNYPPAVMSALMSSITVKDISSTILNLVRKKYLIIEHHKTFKTGLFSDKEVENYIIMRNNSSEQNISDLDEHERFLIKWFIDKLGTKGKADISKIQENLKNSDFEAMEFVKEFKKWKKLIRDEAKNKYNLIEDNIYAKMSTALKIFLVILGILLTIQPFNIIPIIIFAVVINTNKKTPYGNEQSYKWKAFKKFLKDFSLIDKSEVPSLIIWEHYLVYAVSLGIAKEVIDKLKLVIPSEQFDNNNLTYLHGHNNIISSGGLTTFQNAMSSLSSTASRSSNSSSGDGGGFSSGGGGGGGGSSSGGF